MAFKLTKDQRDQLNTLVSDYNSALVALTEKFQEIIDEWEEGYYSKSGHWQESEIGEAARGNIDDLGEIRDNLPDEFSFDVEQFS